MAARTSTKVFGIGFQKTGTSSLGRALTVLGYDVAGPFGVTWQNIGDVVVEEAIRRARKHDAVQDSPWPLLFRQLDDAFPDSRFVLTLRDPQDWIRSIVRHFSTRSTRMREWIYGPGMGSPVGNEEIYLERHARHVQEVREYFSGRQDRLLEMNFAEGHGWDELCGFLGLPVPRLPFPRANTAAERESSSQGISRAGS